jgi:filamentous hemagglutinin
MAAGAAAPVRPGTTASRAAAAVEAHGARPGSAWPQLIGDQQAKNSAAQRLIEDILNDPSSTIVLRPNHPRFGNCVDIVAADGRGLRYDIQGNFITVLEPAP